MVLIKNSVTTFRRVYCVVPLFHKNFPVIEIDIFDRPNSVIYYSASQKTRHAVKQKEKVPAAENDRDLRDPILNSISTLAERVSNSETAINRLADLPEVLQKQSEVIGRIYEQMNSFGLPQEIEMDSDCMIEDDNNSVDMMTTPVPVATNFLGLLQNSEASGNFDFVLEHVMPKIRPL